MATLAGYRRVRGTAARYLTPGGREISDWQYRGVVAQRGGFQSYPDYLRFRRSDMWDEWLEWRFRIRAAHTGADTSLEGGLPEAFRDLMIQRRNHDEDRSPDSALAKLLIAMGIRDPEVTYNVGDTP